MLKWLDLQDYFEHNCFYSLLAFSLTWQIEIFFIIWTRFACFSFQTNEIRYIFRNRLKRRCFLDALVKMLHSFENNVLCFKTNIHV